MSIMWAGKPLSASTSAAAGEAGSSGLLPPTAGVEEADELLLDGISFVVLEMEAYGRRRKGAEKRGTTESERQGRIDG